MGTAKVVAITTADVPSTIKVSPVCMGALKPEGASAAMEGVMMGSRDDGIPTAGIKGMRIFEVCRGFQI